MDADYIGKWAEQVMPELDAPESLLPEINCVIHDWSSEANKTKVVIITPVEYRAAIANMGVSILYDILNNRRDDWKQALQVLEALTLDIVEMFVSEDNRKPLLFTQGDYSALLMRLAS